MGRKVGTKNNKSLETRFWEKVSIDYGSGCWNWRKDASLGYFYIDRGIKSNARRSGYFMCYGEMPDGELKCLCKNKLCVNPSHHIVLSSYEDRFWLHVDKRNKDECWNWLGSTDKKGYGRIHCSVTPKAHRYSYYIHNNEELPDDKLVCHHCDNPSCVNSAHLWLGTHLDNALDKVKKGRHKGAVGENNGSAKLTEKHIKAIRYLYESGEFSTYDLEEIFPVSRPTIAKIIHGQLWSHVE